MFPRGCSISIAPSVMTGALGREGFKGQSRWQKHHTLSCTWRVTPPVYPLQFLFALKKRDLLKCGARRTGGHAQQPAGSGGGVGAASSLFQLCLQGVQLSLVSVNIFVKQLEVIQHVYYGSSS